MVRLLNSNAPYKIGWLQLKRSPEAGQLAFTVPGSF